ncbi:metal-binding protein [Microvirga sp. KLBC 81]|uniref:DUF411 domain-containing protein n=1 Tax=Microvirga sp. KLBC 81 TaxID=1862707 RepID=UPI000D50F8DA|nr:DUF411 domain-containing protein [Microvirga sp. KLBC 81]PVE21634.1 metal-binding protein [Microvirga sp. KLBC 81]
MQSNLTISRRALLTALIASPIAMRTASAETLPKMLVTKDPTCGCCGAWVDHVRSAGFTVEVIESPEMNRVKARLAVPQDLASCHTAEIGGYVIEGHVPADSIKRLLAEKPSARGLAVPGMPAGSPGMEVAGMEPETFDVVLFGPSGQRSFARYKGSRPA